MQTLPSVQPGAVGLGWAVLADWIVYITALV